MTFNFDNLVVSQVPEIFFWKRGEEKGEGNMRNKNAKIKQVQLQ